MSLDEEGLFKVEKGFLKYSLEVIIEILKKVLFK